MVKVKGRSKLSESSLTRVNMLSLLEFLTGPTKTGARPGGVPERWSARKNRPERWSAEEKLPGALER